MGLFYTKKGDKGTSYIGKIKVKKTSPYTMVLGEMDELNSMVGVVKSMKVNTIFKKKLHEVQENLFIIQANIAYKMLKSKQKPPILSESKISEMEKFIDDCEAKIKPPKKFVISGTTNISAWLDFLRAKSRKTERAFFNLAGKSGKLDFDPAIQKYLNRLSSLFFALARLESKKSGKKEFHPKYR